MWFLSLVLGVYAIKQHVFIFSENICIYLILSLVGNLVAHDIGILFGASGKNARHTFDAEKSFVTKLLDQYTISPTQTLIGAVTYAKDASVAIPVGSATSKEGVKKAIARIRYPGDGANLRKALEVARDQLFSVTQGARRNVPKTLIVFVDKKSSSVPAELSSIVESLRTEEIKVIAVGIGDEVDPNELQILADNNDALFFPHTLEDLERQVIPVVEASQPGKLDHKANF